MPRVTAADIQDRSKGDALSKMIALLQTKLFLLHSIARALKRLALTELELVTLALVILDVVIFVVWWHKPLGVQEPVKIYLKVETKIKQEDEFPQASAGLAILCCDDSIYCSKMTLYHLTRSSPRAGNSSGATQMVLLTFCQIHAMGASSISSADFLSPFLSSSFTPSPSLSLFCSPLAPYSS